MNGSGGTDFVDYYALLGVPPGADATLIRRAFIQKAKEHHPDVGGSTQMMRLLNTAYKTLMSATAKASYDMLHSFHAGTTKPGQYAYQQGRVVRDVADMTDAEIDRFLDSVLAEYRNKPKKPRPTFKQVFKTFFEI